MSMHSQLSKFKIHMVIFGIFSLLSLSGSIFQIPFLLDLGILLCSLTLGISALTMLKNAVSFQRFLFWIVSFVWCKLFSILFFVLEREQYFIIPSWLKHIFNIVHFLPSLFLFFTCCEILYLIQERIDLKFFLINVLGFSAFFGVLVFGILTLHVLPGNSQLSWSLVDGLDLLTIVLLGTTLASLPRKQLHTGVIITFTGIAIFNLIDLSYIILSLFSVSKSFLMYWSLLCLLPPLLLALALRSLIVQPNHITTAAVSDNDFFSEPSYIRFRVHYLLFALSLIVLLFNLIELSIFFFMNLILLVYLLISNSYQVAANSRQYMKQQQLRHNELEETVKQRNIDILKQNIKLQEVANRDALTNAYNRRYLQELLSILDEDAQLLAIDILQFNNINQVFGDSVGDSVLIHLYKVLQQAFPTHPIFRVDSNEYVILIRGKAQNIDQLSKKIFEAVEKPFISEFYKITLDVGVGVSTYSAEAPTEKPDNLLSQANFALNEVKSSVVLPRILVFDQKLADKKYRYGLIQSLLDSINYDEEFILYFQPQYSADGSALIGVEALLRWSNPKLGMVSPGEFIPIAEESPTIIKIVDWTLKKACTQIKAWNTEYGRQLKVGINISPKYVEKPSFYEDLQRLVLSQELNVNWLDLEITETSVMHLDLSVIDLFKKLSDFGISTSIDDFGTGYSSLSYIKNLKISTLKIAKELVDSLSQDSSDALIINAIIKMAQGLNIKTIAEGVETKEQLQALHSLGCDYIQGYYFGRPLPADEFVKMHL